MEPRIVVGLRAKGIGGGVDIEPVSCWQHVSEKSTKCDFSRRESGRRYG